MSHPAVPESVTELREAWSQSAHAILDLALTCRGDDFEKPTQCPGWTVKDQLSHLTGIEKTLLGEPDEPMLVPDYPWLRNDFGRALEQAVELRRSRPGHEVVAELKRVLTRREAMLERLDPQTPIGEMPGAHRLPVPADGTVADLLRVRLVDLWCHEQDLREALNHPGGLDTPGAAYFVSLVLRAFPGRVAKAGVPVGSTIILESTGPIRAREGARVVPAADGKVRAEPLFSGAAHVDERDETTGEIMKMPAGSITSIHLSTDALTRRAAGRVAVADLAYSAEGDQSLAAAVLDRLVIIP